MMKKLMSVVLTICLALSLLPAVALPAAADNTPTSGYCGGVGDGTNLQWSFDPTNGILTISGSGKMKDFNKRNHDQPWYSQIERIKKVVVTDGVTSIGELAFTDFENLETVVLPNAAEGFSINKQAFDDCTSLKKINIPEGTQNLGDYALRRCSSLSSVYLPDSVTNVGKEMFRNCFALTEVRLPRTLPQIVYAMFWRCYNLKSIEIPSTVDEVCTYGFAECNSLVQINLPDQLKKIDGEAFYRNLALTKINIPATTSFIGDGTFSSCAKLKTINVATDNMSYASVDGVLYTKDMTVMCCYPAGKSSEIYNVPSTVTCLKMDDLSSNYYNYPCANNFLVKINIPAATSSILVNNVFFYNYYRLEQINVDPNNPNYSSVDGVLYNKNQTELYRYPSARGGTSFTLPDTVTKIYHEAFQNNNNLRSAYFKNNAPSVDGSGSGTLFEGCNPECTIYYTKGTSGWTDPWEGCKTAVQNPENIKVTFVANDNNDTMWSIPTAKGGKIQRPDEPSKTGHAFRGWYTNANCTGTPWNFDVGTVDNDITLYAKWSEIFNRPEGVFSFTNSGKYFACSDYNSISFEKRSSYHYDISSHDYNLLLANIPASNNAAISAVQNARDSTWGGSCFGMSAVACMAAAGKIQLENYETGVSNLSNMQISMNTHGCSDVGKVESLINFYQLLQMVGPVLKARTCNMLNESTNLKTIISKMNSSEYPVILCLALKNSSGTTIGGHAVVAYNLQTSENKYTFDVYDCSMGPQKTYTVTINVNGSVYTADCAQWESDWGYSIFFKYALLVGDLQQANSLLQEAEESDDYELFTNYPSFTVTDGNNSATITNDVPQDGNAISVSAQGPQNEVGTDAKYLYILPTLQSGGTYTITPAVSGSNVDGDKKCKTALYYDDDDNGFFAQTETADVASVTIRSDGAVSTNSDEVIQQTIRSATNLTSTEWNNTEVSGSTASLTIEPGKTESNIETDTASNLLIRAVAKDNSTTFSNVTVGCGASLQLTSIQGNKCALVQNGNMLASQTLGNSVTFDSGIGTAVASQVNIALGSKVTEPAAPTARGYLFDGWYKDSNYSEPWNFETDTVSGNITLYAKWHMNPEFFKTVSFCADGIDNQTILVESGTMLNETQLPSASQTDKYSVAWDTDAVNQLLKLPVTKDTVVYGTLTPNMNGEAVSLSGASISNDYVSVTLANNSAAQIKAMLHMAVYDERNKLLSIKSIPILMSRDSRDNEGARFADCDFTRVKFFVTYGDGNSPMCECASITKPE